MLKNVYLCIEMSGKGSISRMSDECLMKQEFGFPFYIVYQAVMRKFTLAGKAYHYERGKKEEFYDGRCKRAFLMDDV